LSNGDERFLSAGVKVLRPVPFLALTSQYFEDAWKVPELAQEHEERLNEELRLASRVVVFQHIPWFLTVPDEKGNYFSIKPGIRKSWLEKFKNSGNRLILY
jgi:hypothetical protein